MDLHAALLALLAPMKVGDEITPGIRLAGAVVDAGPRLLFETEGESILVEVGPIEMGAPAAASSARLRIAYIAQGPRGRACGFSLCQLVAARARANENRVLGSLTHVSDAPRLRDVRVSRLLEPARDGDRTFHTLSPYVGCLIGCRFCYAQSHVALARRLAALPVAPWGSYVDVRVNAADVLTKELETLDVTIVKVCPIVSDPYHALEATRGVTRACLEAMATARRRPTVMVLTRSGLIERDAELLGSMGAHAGFSLPTLDDEVRAHFEPRAASVAERLAALRALRGAGASTFAVVQPMMPGSIDALADDLASHCDSVSLDVLRGVEGATREFGDPRFAHVADPSWQSDHAHALADALRARGVPVWQGELPPNL